MADILIKNMEMPKNCRSCPLIYETSREFTCWQIMKKWPIKEAEHRQEGCPLVALPEHGDLIDRDELLTDLADRMCVDDMLDGIYQPAIDRINEAETIVEAT